VLLGATVVLSQSVDEILSQLIGSLLLGRDWCFVKQHDHGWSETSPTRAIVSALDFRSKLDVAMALTRQRFGDSHVTADVQSFIKRCDTAGQLRNTYVHSWYPGWPGAAWYEGWPGAAGVVRVKASVKKRELKVPVDGFNRSELIGLAGMLYDLMETGTLLRISMFPDHDVEATS
jgi:hypothetical protein